MKISHNSYAFIEHKGETDWYVQIKEGDYKGIIYKYGAIQVKEDADLQSASLKFHFNIAKIPEDLEISSEEIQQDETFMNLLGDILSHILEDAMDSGKYKIGKNDKPTDPESTMHE